jgi:hypothetical protein
MEKPGKTIPANRGNNRGKAVDGFRLFPPFFRQLPRVLGIFGGLACS